MDTKVKQHMVSHFDVIPYSEINLFLCFMPSFSCITFYITSLLFLIVIIIIMCFKFDLCVVLIVC